MPNYVTNVLRCEEPGVLARLVDDAGRATFAHLIPPPENIETSGCSGQHAPGVVCWYQWNIANWGTKWDAGNSTKTATELRFDTAWSHPAPVVAALAAAHPEARIEVDFADEDLGSNCGSYVVQGGAVEARELEDPRDFAARLIYGKSYADVRAEWDADC